MNNRDDTPKNRIVLLKHETEPLDDRVYAYFVQNGFDVDIVRPCMGEEIEFSTDDVAGTVIYGGPQNVDEISKYPYLKSEYRWIDACLKADVPMLGICLGAQQVAHHLGADIHPLNRFANEFGYYEVMPTEEGCAFLQAPLYVAHSHEYYFDIPRGAVHLAKSELCDNQAFQFGDLVYGLQFHAEVSKAGFGLWQDLYRQDRKARIGEQSDQEIEIRMQKYDAAQGKWFFEFMGKLFRKH